MSKKVIKLLTIIAFVLFLSALAFYLVKYFEAKKDANGLKINTTALEIMVADVDGNLYHTVKIGTQVWLKENLKVEHYNDGSPIANVTDNTAWANFTTGAYCYYNNDTGFKDTYGALYNWYAVGTKKLAPAGWHVASDEEWTTLKAFLGNARNDELDISGGKLKEAGTVHWNSPNYGATNSSGFTALPGGDRESITGLFSNMTKSGYFWSSTACFGEEAWGKHLSWNYINLSNDASYSQEAGFSVRCVKD